MALNLRQFNDLLYTQRKAGGSSGVTMAKKLADLYVSTHTNEAGKVVDPAVYQYAIETYLAPYAGDVDADNAIANYANSMKSIANKHATSKQSVGQFKLQERDIMFVTPSSAYRDDILGDLPSMVSQITDELSIHNLEVLRAIDTAEANGDDTYELESYLMSSQKRLNKMIELNNDLITGEVSAGELYNEVGIFIDADQDDGGVRGVGIMPIDDLPFGMSKDDFKRIEASTELGGGFLPVYGSYSQNQYGEWQVNINGNKWSGTGSQPLQFEGRESVNPDLKAEDGGFALSNLQMKSPGIQANKFFKGYTGFDENNNPKEQYYYADQQGQIYAVSDTDLTSLKNDPTQSSLIKNATRVDSDFARNIERSNVVKPYSEAPAVPAQPVAPPPSTPAEESGGFFRKAGRFIKNLFSSPEGEPVSSGTQTSTPAFFANRTNSPSAVKTPQEVGGAAQAPDIVSQGNSFFRSRV